MPLETGDTIAELNPAWPLGSDPKSQGDDHIRLVKDVMQKDAVAKSGDTMTGRLTIDGPDAVPLEFSVEAATAARIRWVDNAQNQLGFIGYTPTPNGRFQVQLESTNAAIVEPAGTNMPDDVTVVTREKGDARYVELAGDTITGNLTLTNDVGTPFLIDRPGQVVAGIGVAASTLIFQIDGGNVARIDPAGTSAPASTTTITREKGDARYPQLTAENTLTNTLNVFSGTTAVINLRGNPGSGSARVRWLDDLDGQRAFIGLTTGDPARIQFQIGSTNAAIIEANGTSVPDGVSVITREKGDARYTQSAAMLALMDKLFQAGILTAQDEEDIEALMAVEP